MSWILILQVIAGGTALESVPMSSRAACEAAAERAVTDLGPKAWASCVKSHDDAYGGSTVDPMRAVPMAARPDIGRPRCGGFGSRLEQSAGVGVC